LFMSGRLNPRAAFDSTRKKREITIVFGLHIERMKRRCCKYGGEDNWRVYDTVQADGSSGAGAVGPTFGLMKDILLLPPARSAFAGSILPAPRSVSACLCAEM
jgi:hypothetical protein